MSKLDNPTNWTLGSSSMEKLDQYVIVTDTARNSAAAGVKNTWLGHHSIFYI